MTPTVLEELGEAISGLPNQQLVGFSGTYWRNTLYLMAFVRNLDGSVLCIPYANS